MIRPDNERKKTMILIALPFALRGLSAGGISGRDSPDRELKNERIRTLLPRQIRDAEFAGAGDWKHRPPVHSPYERCSVGLSMCVAGCNRSRLRTKPVPATTDEHKLTQIEINNQSVFIRVHLWLILSFSKCRERLLAGFTASQQRTDRYSAPHPLHSGIHLPKSTQQS